MKYWWPVKMLFLLFSQFMVNGSMALTYFCVRFMNLYEYFHTKLDVNETGSTEEIKKDSPISHRIVDGREAEESDYNSIVSLRRKEMLVFLIAVESIVNERWILTVRHVLTEIDTERAPPVSFSKYDNNGSKLHNSPYYEAEKTFCHPSTTVQLHINNQVHLQVSLMPMSMIESTKFWLNMG